MSLIQTITNEILNDGEDQSERLVSIEEAADETGQAAKALGLFFVKERLRWK